MSRTAIIVVGLLALSACGQEQQPKTAAKKEATKPAPRIDRPVEDVLAKVPPEQRNAVQSALACRVKANKGPALRITPDLIQDIVGKLKSDPSVAKC